MESIRVVRLDLPPNMEMAIAIPCVPTAASKTAIARAILPTSIPHENAHFDTRNAVLIVAGIHLGNVDTLGRGMRTWGLNR